MILSVVTPPDTGQLKYFPSFLIVVMRRYVFPAVVSRRLYDAFAVYL